MQMTFTTEKGEEHGLINSVGNSVPDDGFKRFADKDKENMKKLKAEEEEIIKARYLNAKGAPEKLERPYMRWAGKPITFWRFLHNHVYNVPRGLVEEVNKNPGIPTRSEILDSRGIPTKVEGAAKKEHQFVPAEF